MSSVLPPLYVPPSVLQRAEDVRALFAHVNHWGVDSNALVFSIGEGPFEKRYLFPDEQVNTLHPRLAATLRAAAKHEPEKDHLFGKNRTFLEWQLSLLCDPAELATPQGTRYVVHEIEALYWKPRQRQVHLFGSVCLCHSWDANERTPFVRGLAWKELCAPLAWMDGRVPGWRERLATAVALGLTDKEQVVHVFDQPEINAVLSLPDGLTV